MDSRQGIFWHQGLFLQPQHFQYLEQHQAFARQVLTRLTGPYPWGVEQIEISETAISNAMVELRSFRALLPDQTYLEYPGNVYVAARSFDKVWTDPDKPLHVYLALRRLSPAIPNVTVVDTMSQASAVTSRFASISNPASVRDIFADATEALVPTVLYVARLVFHDELEKLEDYDVLPLAVLSRDGEKISLLNSFVPPVTLLTASPRLISLVRDIRDDMLGRLRRLEEYKSPRGINAEDLDVNFLMMMQAVQVLNRHVPALNHLIEAPGVHPWLVYGQLRQCVGELSTFSHRLDVFGRFSDADLGLPSYDHANLGQCFQVAKDLVSKLLTEIAVGPEFHITLLLRDGIYVSEIPAEFFAERNRFYLVLQSVEALEVPVPELLGSARVASPDVISDLVDYALPGIELLELPGPPQGLPRRGDSRYFRIEQLSEGWERVQDDEALAFYWPEAPQDLRVVVVVTKG